MRNYLSEGTSLRLQIKELVLDFMKRTDECSPDAEGLKQADIFRSCGLDWDDQPNATSSQQHFWVVGLLRVLEKDNLVQRDITTKKWRLK